jgi:hypothetical protein
MFPPVSSPSINRWNDRRISLKSYSCLGYLYCGLLNDTHRTGNTQKNGAISKVDKNVIFHPTRAQLTLSATDTVQVSHALPAVRFPCLLWARGTRFQDGVAAGEGFLCVPF